MSYNLEMLAYKRKTINSFVRQLRVLSCVAHIYHSQGRQILSGLILLVCSLVQFE